METQQLRQNLLSEDQLLNEENYREQAVRQRRFTIGIPTSRNMEETNDQLRSLRASSFQRLIRTQIMEDWNEEEIVERRSLFGEQLQINEQGNQILPLAGQEIAAAHKKKNKRNDLNSEVGGTNEVTKILNNRIFRLGKKIQKFLYIFNLIFNTAFRASLVVILILEFFEKKQNTIPTAVLLGLEGVCILLYAIAMTKILYTKSSQISVFFQKEFYQKPYAQIFMERVLRKHFTFHKFRSNFLNFINPFSDFNWNIKISLIRQQIFKRMEIVLVGIPLVICYAFDIPWFNLQLGEEDNESSMKTGIVMSIVLICEFFRLTVHYLIIYIFS